MAHTKQTENELNLERKIELVKEWGFEKRIFSDSFSRSSYKEEGYIEIWYESQPDLIVFFKDGLLSHDYVIDWALFN